MTSQLKAEFEAIDLQNMIKPMFNQLDEVIEYAIENMDEEVSSLDIIDYITDCMQFYLEDRRALNEDEDLESPLTLDEIHDYLIDEGYNDYDVGNYLKFAQSDRINTHLTTYWSYADWGDDFNQYINDTDEFSDEELMKEHFKRHAGL